MKEECNHPLSSRSIVTGMCFDCTKAIALSYFESEYVPPVLTLKEKLYLLPFTNFLSTLED